MGDLLRVMVLAAATALIWSAAPREAAATFEAKAQDFSYYVSGMEPSFGTRSYTLTIADIAPVANPVSATVAANSSGNPITLNITGGTPTSLATPTLPTKGSVTVAGTSITYTPTAGYSGTDSFTYTTTNAAGTSAPATVSLTVTPPTLSLAAISPFGEVTTPYGAMVVASLGTTPYSIAKTSGTLPPGLSLEVNGVLTGTPTAPGSFTFEVTATDTYGATGTQSYTITIARPGIWVTSPAAGALPSATAGSGYSQTFTARGGAGSHTFEVTAGALPAGMTLSPAGILAGTPAATGTFNFSVTPSDSSPAPGPFRGSPHSYTLTVGKAAPTLHVSAPSNPAFGAPVTFTAMLAGGAAPGGTVTFKDGTTTLGTETISGTTATFTSSAVLMPGPRTITVVYDGDANNAAVTTFITVIVGQAAPTIALSASPSNPMVGAPVTFTATLAGGASPSGTVTFKDGATTLGTGTISSGTATFSTKAPAVGTHTITAEYDGDANNSAAIASLTVTVGKAAPTIAVSASDSNPAVGAPVTFTATLAGGASPSGTVTFKDGDTTLGTGTISSGTATFSTTAPAVGTHTITAEYGGDANNTAATASLTVTVGKAAPTLSLSASDTAPAVGASVTFTATLAGGAAPSGTVTFKDGATTLGTGTISGTTASFTTAALVVGAHSITAEYGGDTNNATAPSAALTVTVGQAAPTLSVSASDTAPAFGASVTFTATLAGGAAPSGTVTFKDGATTLGTGTISGTTASFTTAALAVGAHSITAEYGGDTNNATATSAALTVKVAAVAVFTFTPAGGALTAAMAGEDYSQSISATGGTGTLTYSLASGALPAGVMLNASTGELTGPLDENAAVKAYGFTIEVRDGNGATGTASYSLKVTERIVAVTDKAIDMSAGGAPANVNLANGATGGPFTGADLIFVQPANAGAASIVRGEFAQASGPTPLGWYLKFIPNPAFSGTAKVGFRLTSALGVSNTGIVTYTLGYAPAKVAEEIDGLVHGFVQTRQNLIASTIKIPGLLERRQAAKAVDPATARMSPSKEGMTASFSTSLAQMKTSRDRADGVAGGYSRPFNIWIDGTLMAHNRDENGGKWGSFGMINLGADYLLSEKALIGLSFHFDRTLDPTDEDAELTGNGWLAGPYASFELGKGVFLDTSLLYGGSANDIDTAFWDGGFDTTRWLIDTAIKGVWQLDEVTVLKPQLRAIYFNEKVEDYTVGNATGDELTINGFDEEQFRVSLGAEIARSFTLDSGSVLTPKLGVTGGYAGLDGSGAFGSLTVDLALETVDFWTLETGLLFNVESDGQKSVGGRARAAKQF